MYVFRCAIYYAENIPKEKQTRENKRTLPLKDDLLYWWNWSDAKMKQRENTSATNKEEMIDNTNNKKKKEKEKEKQKN